MNQSFILLRTTDRHFFMMRDQNTWKGAHGWENKIILYRYTCGGEGWWNGWENGWTKWVASKLWMWDYEREKIMINARMYIPSGIGHERKTRDLVSVCSTILLTIHCEISSRCLDLAGDRERMLVDAAARAWQSRIEGLDWVSKFICRPVKPLYSACMGNIQDN